MKNRRFQFTYSEKSKRFLRDSRTMAGSSTRFMAVVVGNAIPADAATWCSHLVHHPMCV